MCAVFPDPAAILNSTSLPFKPVSPGTTGRTSGCLLSAGGANRRRIPPIPHGETWLSAATRTTWQAKSLRKACLNS